MAEPTGEIPQYIKKPNIKNVSEKKDYLKTIMDSTRSVLDKIRAEISAHTQSQSENVGQKPAFETTPQSQNVGQKPAGTPIEGSMSTTTATTEHLRLPLTLETLGKKDNKSENKPAFETTPQSQNVGQKPAGTTIEGSTTTSTVTLGTVETGLSTGGQVLPSVNPPIPPNNLP